MIKIGRQKVVKRRRYIIIHPADAAVSLSGFPPHTLIPPIQHPSLWLKDFTLMTVNPTLIN